MKLTATEKETFDRLRAKAARFTVTRESVRDVVDMIDAGDSKSAIEGATGASDAFIRRVGAAMRGEQATKGNRLGRTAQSYVDERCNEMNLPATMPQLELVGSPVTIETRLTHIEATLEQLVALVERFAKDCGVE